jgi:hypothetical protein
MHYIPLVIALAVSGPASADQQNEPLTNDALREINQTFTATHQFADNEFLYEEKLAEAVEQAKRYVGRPVRIGIRVERVSKTHVSVTLFPEQVDMAGLGRSRIVDRFAGGPRGGQEGLPKVAFVEDADAAKDVEFSYSRSDETPGLGGTMAGGRQSGRLAVPGLVPVELARQLREGDRLVITGTLQAISPAPTVANIRDDFGRPQLLSVAGFVVSHPKAEKAGRQEGP